MNAKRLKAAAAVFALFSLASPLGAESAAAEASAENMTGDDESRREKSVEVSFGADGAAAAYFVAPEGGRLSVGVRVGLGFEWADYLLNDPAAALAVRYTILASRRWAWRVGAEAGAAYIHTGYARFAVPFAGASTGARFRFGRSFSSFLEAGGRFGRRNLEHEASLDFLDARYEETVFIDPLVLRLGLALTF